MIVEAQNYFLLNLYQVNDFQDQLVSALPVRSGMGMTLLQKMGWKPGEGLGKNKEGCQEPLQLEVKMDRKGKFLLSCGSQLI